MSSAKKEAVKRRGLSMADLRQLEVSVEIPGTEDDEGEPAVVTFVCERIDVGRAAELEELQAKMKADDAGAGAALLAQMGAVVIDTYGFDDLEPRRPEEALEAYRNRFLSYFREAGAGAELVVATAVGHYFELQAPRPTFRRAHR